MFVAGNSVAIARAAVLAAASQCDVCAGPTDSPFTLPDVPTIVINDLAPKDTPHKLRDTKSPHKIVRSRAKRKVEKAQKRAQRHA
jgi:hypothetical protein